MKRIILSLLIVAVTFASCSKDDGGSDTNSGSEISEANLIGKWLLTDRTRDGKAVELDPCDLKSSYEFKSDKIAIYVETGIIGEGTNEEVCKEWASSEKWSLSGSTLTVTYEGEFEVETDISEITELSSTKLSLKYSDSRGASIWTYKKV
ncbi:lipocalin family protein [Aquimarina sp. 2-A2]|uniref:lipocalin family protein n=1 Tax=Aquimarina sp. 2-A2 TaxID=3382644 RepID=UPI00387F2BF7